MNEFDAVRTAVDKIRPKLENARVGMNGQPLPVDPELRDVAAAVAAIADYLEANRE